MHQVNINIGQLNAFDWSPDAASYAVGGSEKSIIGFDTKTQQKTFELKSEYSFILKYIKEFRNRKFGHGNNIFSIKYAPEGNGRILVSGDWDKTIMVWDVRTKLPTVTLSGPKPCSDNAIDIAGNYVLTANWSPTDTVQVRQGSICNLTNSYGTYGGVQLDTLTTGRIQALEHALHTVPNLVVV